MTYAKPEIGTLGSATRVIEYPWIKPYPNSLDGVFGQQPAYDLDS